MAVDSTSCVLAGALEVPAGTRFFTGSREILTPPRDLQARLARAGGLNLYGEPSFRLVWGWSRMSWMGGMFECDRADGSSSFEVGYRLEPKYVPENRWYLEAWNPPEKYGTPERWERDYELVRGEKIYPLGPYPSRGEYEVVTRLQRRDGSFAYLTHTTADLIVNLVRRNQEMRHADRRARINAAAMRDELAAQARDEAILNDIPWSTYKKPHIVVPGNFGGIA